MNKLILTIGVAALAAAGVVILLQNQSQTKLRADNESLRQQLNLLTQLQADNEQLSNRLAQANTAAEKQAQELLKLRNEVGTLRKQSGVITDLQRKNQQLSDALAGSRNPPPVRMPEPAPSAAANTGANPPAAPAAPFDLGTVQLVNETPTRFDLGAGRSCTLTPTIDANGNYNIKVLFETKGPDGQSETDIATINTGPGIGVTLNAGDNSIAFTPTVSPNQ